MIVDITADINGTSANFQKLPAMGDIADFGNNIVVSCNKEAMNSEVSSMKQRSLDIINSIETHQSIIKGCDEILQQLNPEIIEKQRQEQENKALREEINSLKEMFKEYIDKVLTQNNIKLENNVGYDYVFVGNMCKADYYGSSITDERHFALYIKDTIDDEDAGDGTTMRRWYATMVANGTMVDWEDVI